MVKIWKNWIAPTLIYLAAIGIMTIAVVTVVELAWHSGG
jgi:hypothetical protein